MATETGEGLLEILEGSSNLPESAAGKAQKPLPARIGFGWKPSEEQTQRDILEADRRDRAIREAIKFVEDEERMSLESSRKSVAASKGFSLGVDLQRLLQDVKGTIKDPIERLGAATKKALTLPPLPASAYGVDAITGTPPVKKTPIDKKKAAELATDITPIGAAVGMIKKAGEAVEPIAKRIVTDLGNEVTLTPSAKEVGKYQITHWEGKAGISNTVQDEVFDTADEALTVLQKYEATNK